MKNPRLVEIEFLDKHDDRATWVHIRVGSEERSGWVARDSDVWRALMVVVDHPAYRPGSIPNADSIALSAVDMRAHQ